MITFFDRIVGKTIVKAEYQVVEREEIVDDEPLYTVFLTFEDGTKIEITTDRPVVFNEGREWIKFPVFHNRNRVMEVVTR